MQFYAVTAPLSRSFPHMSIADTQKSAIGSRLKEERERLGMSQKEFGELSGNKDRTVASWEAGQATPNAVALYAQGAAGVDIDYVITGRRAIRAESSRVGRADSTSTQQHANQLNYIDDVSSHESAARTLMEGFVDEYGAAQDKTPGHTFTKPDTLSLLPVPKESGKDQQRRRRYAPDGMEEQENKLREALQRVEEATAFTARLVSEVGYEPGASIGAIISNLYFDGAKESLLRSLLEIMKSYGWRPIAPPKQSPD